MKSFLHQNGFAGTGHSLVSYAAGSRNGLIGYIAGASCILVMTLSMGACEKRITASGPSGTLKTTSTTAAVSPKLSAPIHNSLVLFNGGDEGAGCVTTYHFVRFPSIVSTS